MSERNDQDHGEEVLEFSAKNVTTIEAVEPDAVYGVEGAYGGTFAIASSKKESKKLSRSKADVVYDVRKGKLYLNDNGKEKGWGKKKVGGLVATFKNKPVLSVCDFVGLSTHETDGITGVGVEAQSNSPLCLREPTKPTEPTRWRPEIAKPVKYTDTISGITWQMNDYGLPDNLRGADLRGVHLRRAGLKGADLQYADLRDAKLGNADLRGVDLRNAELEGARLGGADLTGADLRGVDLSLANIKGAWFQSADLRDAKLGEATLNYGSLKHAKLTNADLEGADLRNVDLYMNANLMNMNLRNADLREAKLGYSNLEGADLRGADLRGADLRAADMYFADLEGAKLTPYGALPNVILIDADLRRVNFSRAQLNYAYLDRADLKGAYFSGANLKGADLQEADLTGAFNMDQALNNPSWGRDTICPDGNKATEDSDSVAAGLTNVFGCYGDQLIPKFDIDSLA